MYHFLFKSKHVNTDIISSKRPVPHKTVVLAEFALQLEFVRLSQLTGNPVYERIGNSIIEKIQKTGTPVPGLYSIFWDSKTFLPKDSK